MRLLVSVEQAAFSGEPASKDYRRVGGAGAIELGVCYSSCTPLKPSR